MAYKGLAVKSFDLSVKTKERSREMNQRELWREIKSLPPEAQREVVDFIAFLRIRYKPPCPSDESRNMELAEEPFVGMWRNRADMEDSNRWVRTIREREWATP
jgi:hypothetical protein